MADSLEELSALIREFADERDWHQFHSPKNLAMALVVEAGELVEIFQWLTQDQSMALDRKTRAAAADEIGDVLIYLCRLADRLGIDPVRAARDKMKINRKKYPVSLARAWADRTAAGQNGSDT